MTNPKVTIVVGGRWHAIDLARELHQAGWLHRLITNYPKFKTRQWGVPDDKVVSLPFTLLLNRAIPKIGGEKMMRKFLPQIYRLFAKAAVPYLEGSTLIHAWSSMAEPSINWAKQNGIPVVLERSSAHIMVQSQILEEEYKQLGLEFVSTEVHPEIVAQELREYKLADRIAVPSLFAKRTFLQQGFNEAQLIHNPFGTSLETFAPKAKEDDVFRVVYAGSLGVRKGVYYLVRAFIEANLPHSELVLLGKVTPETPQLLTGADERVKCIGHVSETRLAEFYRNSSVFVMPSLEEGLALVQAQALACGIPLICTTNTGGEDLLRIQGEQPIKLDKGIEEYPAGYLVPVKSSKAISSLLELLASNSDLLAQKRQATMNFQLQDLSWKQYAKRAMQAYQQMLSQKLKV
ncbi:glycosyl transferase [Pleurocapsa sp. CCALA 161]|uniref:glycosyltransferase family 4 protein n=1 Tax=Pleurocapsa sp. CCALA 161 TaxID=2107688 RepID=UPI000D064EF5|nr:glycosyltransferase family 4 protein [Pleurocapsa sp. CCALA 161]PSB08302.1 glycosyl transferase [Pleurocapsa sp. CCALA 161]